MPPTETPDITPLLDGLRELLRVGLPVRPQTAPGVLLKLPSVRARATVAGDQLALVDALDRLVRDELKRLELADLRKPAAELLGARKGGRTLTDRRRQAAALSDYNLDHFRKHVEPKILEQLAWQLYRAGIQFVQRRNGPEPIAESGDTPTIHAEHFTDARTADQEVLLSRIWSDVYGLRAELIAREAAWDDPEKQGELEEATTGSLWYLARLLTKLVDYLERYGRSILHGDAEYDANALIRLAGWTGEVSKEQARELRFALAQAGEWNRQSFAERLKSD